MSIANSNNRVDLVASSGQTIFSYDFKINAADEIAVYLTADGSTPDDATDILILTTDYSVSGVGDDAGGNITLTSGATLDDSISMVRAIDFDQPDEFVVGQDNAEAIESTLDSHAMRIQRLAESVDRAVKSSGVTEGKEYILPFPASGELLSWNTAADAIVNRSALTYDPLALSYTMATKADAVLLDPVTDKTLYILSDDGKGNIWQAVTGAAPGTHSDDGGAFCGTVFIPTGGDGSNAWVRDFKGDAPIQFFGDAGVGSSAGDTAAALLLVDYAINHSGTVYLPSGFYTFTESIGPLVETFGLHFKGDGIQKTIIVGDHNEGPVLSLNRSNSRVSDLTITASATRTAGSATSSGGTWQDNVGLLIEPADIAGKACAQCDLSHVRILNQPSHGLAWIGPQQDNSMKHVLCQNNKGHGAVFDAGILTSRVNTSQIGQMTATDFWGVGNGGNGLAIGNPSDVGGTTPYRFVMINTELADNATDAAFRYTPHEMWMHSENSMLVSGAVGGLNLRGGIAFLGRDLMVDNVRFVQSQPAMTIFGDSDPAQITANIQLRNIRNISTVPSLDPAIVIDDLDRVRNVRIQTATRGNVISWFTVGAQNCVVNESEPVTNVTKKATEIVNNSTTLQDDNELKIALVASEIVQFEAIIKYGGDVTADIEFTFVAPAGATIRWQPMGSTYVDGADNVIVKNTDVTEGSTLVYGCSAGTRIAHVYGHVVMSTTGGDLQLQWAQASAVVADTSVIVGSSLKVFRSNYGN